MNISQAEQAEICNNVLLKYWRYSTRLRGFFNFIGINGSLV